MIDLRLGNCLDELDKIQEESIDSIVTDPPYGLTSITKRFGKENSAPAKFGNDGAFSRLSKGFMGKEWDGSGIEYNVDMWKKCYKVLKKGGYLLAFGGTRTYHRIACAIEDAGFEIRDCIMYLYGSGFPKSMNIGRQLEKKLGKSGNTDIINYWKQFGTTLKPAYEPIIVARKPFKGSLVDNVLENGVGGLNIDECRIGTEQIKTNGGDKFPNLYGKYNRAEETTHNGRFPANVILTYDETDFDEVCGGMPYTKGGNRKNTIANRKSDKISFGYEINTRNEFNDSGSAGRYFYCAKASRKDRDEGIGGGMGEYKVNDGRKTPIDNPFQRGETLRKNIHPTL